MTTGFEKLGIGPGKPPKLILDFCWNHNGAIYLVRDMLLSIRRHLTAEQYELIIPKFQAGRDLPWEESTYRYIQGMCEQEFGLPFLCTAFDYKSVDMLDELGVDAIKIGSAESADFDFVAYAFEKRPLIISTGGMPVSRIIQLSANFPGAKILHCISAYPALADDLRLEFITHAPVDGYSSHFPGIEDAIFAMALGAEVNEKHYSLTPGVAGDHQVSIGDPQARVICDYALSWHKMRGYTKSQDMLDAETALLKPFRDRFYASKETPTGDK